MLCEERNAAAAQIPLAARVERHVAISSPVGNIHWQSKSAKQGVYLVCFGGTALATLLPSFTADAAAGIAALIIYGAWSGWNTAGLGLRLKPIQGWKHWVITAVVLGLIVGLTCLSAWLFAIAFGVYIFVPQIDPSYPPVKEWLIHVLILAPVLEELVYRFALCVPIVRRFGTGRTIIVSGTAFALAHFVGGNPGPDNFIAGFILAWAFLKSGTLLIPILLHFAGNLCVFAFGVLMFYWPIFCHPSYPG